MNAINETWTRKKAISFSEFDNETEVVYTLPARRFGHAMAGGSTIIMSTDAENQPRSDAIDRIVMFGGMGLYE